MNSVNKCRKTSNKRFSGKKIEREYSRENQLRQNIITELDKKWLFFISFVEFKILKVLVSIYTENLIPCLNNFFGY